MKNPKVVNAPKVDAPKVDAPKVDAVTRAELIYSSYEAERSGVRSEYTGNVFLKAPTDNRKSGKGKDILDNMISGETYEEFKARYEILRVEDPVKFPSKYIRNHLDYDLKFGNTRKIPYFDRKSGRIVSELPKEVTEARKGSGLPDLSEILPEVDRAKLSRKGGTKVSSSKVTELEAKIAELEAKLEGK